MLGEERNNGAFRVFRVRVNEEDERMMIKEREEKEGTVKEFE